MTSSDHNKNETREERRERRRTAFWLAVAIVGTIVIAALLFPRGPCDPPPEPEPACDSNVCPVSETTSVEDRTGSSGTTGSPVVEAGASSTMAVDGLPER